VYGGLDVGYPSSTLNSAAVVEATALPICGDHLVTPERPDEARPA
jgi:hypothetical protein